MAVTMNGITFDPTVEVIDGTSLDLTYDDSVVISGVSKVRCTFNVQNTSGQTITKYAVSAGNGVFEDNTNRGYVDINGVPNGSFTFILTTSTGVTATESITLGTIYYFPISCVLEVRDVTFNTDTQATIHYTIKGLCYNGSLGIKNNSLNVQYQWYTGIVPPSSLQWTTVTPSRNGYEYESNIDASVLYTDTVTFAVKVYDELTNSETSMKYRVTPVFDWSETDFNFNVPVKFQGVEMPMVQEVGSNRYWEWKKYSDGTAELWATVSLTGQDISTAWGSMYTSGRLASTNLTFPFEFTKTPTMVASLVPGYAGAILMTTGSSSTPLSSTSTGTYELVRGTIYNGGNYKICYYVRGYWK